MKFGIIAAAFLALLISGCASARRGGLNIAPTDPAASQPAAAPRIDADQIVGTIAAKIAPVIESAIKLAVSTTIAPVLNASANVTMESRIRAEVRAEFSAQGLGNYTSQYGIGAVLSVLGAVVGTLVVVSLALRRSLNLNHFAFELLGRWGEQSHARQLARISAKPLDAAAPPAHSAT